MITGTDLCRRSKGLNMCKRLRSMAMQLVGFLAILNATDALTAGEDDAGSQSGKPSKGVEIRVAPDPDAATTLDHGASINPELLNPVDDTGAGVLPDERDVYFRGLKLAKEIPLANLKEFAAKLQEQRRSSNPKYSQIHAKDFPQYVDLVENPSAYRGHPVTLRGTLRRLTKLAPGKNPTGIGDIYEGWLYTADSNSHPTVALFTRKPAGLETGSNITEEVRVTGYFLKLYSYEAQGGPEIAPMLLAGTVELNPGPRPYVFKPLSPSVYVILTLALFVLGFGIWRASRPGHVEQLLTPKEPDLTHLPPTENH